MKVRTLYFIFLVMALVFGCGKNGDAIPAPMGDIHTLENLADSYNKVSEQFPMNVQALPPQQKHEFVTQVFTITGYDYRATLLSMGATQLDASNQVQKDLAELLLLPTTGLSSDDISDLYADDEINAISNIKTAFD